MKYINKMTILLSLILGFNSLSEITPDGNTNVYVERSNNEVEVINISTPSQKGISDSTFNKFNVDKNGAILNNSTTIGRTRIAGIINRNNNLITPARVALLRVTSTDKSELKGTLEALTKNNLDVILSNKNGITLDGANFFNIHNMTLTTGEVRVKEDGNLSSININNNKEILTLTELNTNNVNTLNILSGVSRIEKDLIGNNINLVTGSNIVNIDGNEVEVVKTQSGELGIPISAEILGSIHGDSVRIIATKSGIGVKSIVADSVDIESKSQIKTEAIISNTTKISQEEDFNNAGNIIANNNLSIEARNILNDNNKVLVSDNISLKAKEDILNRNGSIIYATNKLNIESNNLDNLGNVKSYGTYIKKWISANGDVFDESNIDNWKLNISDKYKDFRWFRGNETTIAKEKALSQFYGVKELLKVEEKQEENNNNNDKDKKPVPPKVEVTGTTNGIFSSLDKYSYLFNKYIDEYKEKHKDKMSLNEDYSGSYTLTEDREGNKTLKAVIEQSNQETNYSVISGKEIEINSKGVVNNKDGKILGDNTTHINSKEFNNTSSISNESVLLQDGKETLTYSGDRTCWGLGLAFCNIEHSASYQRTLNDGREEYIKALPSILSGKDIQIKSDIVNFKDEDKRTVREENILTSTKTIIEKDNKTVNIPIEERAEFTKLSNFYKSANFKIDVRRYIPKNTEDRLKVLEEEIERRKQVPSNIKIDASKLSIRDQKLLFNNILLSSNNIDIQGADVKALNNLDIKANKINIEGIKHKEEINIDARDNGGLIFSNISKEKIIKEDVLSSNLNAKNINIESKDTTIKGSNIEADNIDINSDKLNILSDKTRDERHSYDENRVLIFGNREKVDESKETNHSTNIIGNINIKGKEVLVKGSNLLSNEDISIKANKVDILDEKVKLTTNDSKIVSDVHIESNDVLKDGKAKLNAGYRFNKTDKEVEQDISVKSNLIGKNIKIESSDILNTNADISSESLKLKSKEINLLDSKDKISEKSNEFNLEIGVNARLGSSIIDLGKSIYESVSSKDRNITQRFRDLRNTLSSVHDINRKISKDPTQLIDATIGANIGVDNTNIKKEQELSRKGLIQSNNIELIADSVSITNQEINADSLKIESDVLKLNKGESKETQTITTAGAKIGVEYNVVTQQTKVDANAKVQNNYYEKNRYSDNILNVGNLDIQSKKIEEDKREDSEHTLSYGGSIGTSGIELNYEKDGNGFSIGTTLEGKLTNTSLKLGNEDYDLNGDLIHKENRDNLVNDVKNVINTPSAYAKAVDKTIKYGLDIGSEIRNELHYNNVETETRLQYLKEDIEKEENRALKKLKIEEYLKNISNLRGEEFKNIRYVRDEEFNAAVDKDNNLYINVDRIDIEDISNLNGIMSYESNRWSYPDKEKDDLSVHSTAPNVVNGKTTLDVEEYVLSDEEREGVRENNSFRINDVPEVNIFGVSNKNDLSKKAQKFIKEVAKKDKQSGQNPANKGAGEDLVNAGISFTISATTFSLTPVASTGVAIGLIGLGIASTPALFIAGGITGLGYLSSSILFLDGVNKTSNAAQKTYYNYVGENKAYQDYGKKLLGKNYDKIINAANVGTVGIIDLAQNAPNTSSNSKSNGNKNIKNNLSEDLLKKKEVELEIKLLGDKNSSLSKNEFTLNTSENNILTKVIKESDKGKNISNSSLQNKIVYSKGNEVSSSGKDLPKYNNVTEVIEDANKGNKVISLSQVEGVKIEQKDFKKVFEESGTNDILQVEYESREQLERFLKKHFGEMELKDGIYVFDKSGKYSGMSFRWTSSNLDSKGKEIPSLQYSKKLENEYEVRKMKFIEKGE